MGKRVERRLAATAAADVERARQSAYSAARELALCIGAGRVTGGAAYGTGIVLAAGEAVWAENVPADWLVHETYTWPNGGTAKQWDRHGVRPWLITDRRLVSRQPDGTLSQVVWAAVTGCRVDLAGETVIFNAVDGWQGGLSGPNTAVIAVAAVAGLYGVQALTEHPGLAPLRTVSVGLHHPWAGEVAALPARDSR